MNVIDKAWQLADELASRLEDISDSTNRTKIFETAILRLVEYAWGEGTVTSIIIRGRDDLNRSKTWVIK